MNKDKKEELQNLLREFAVLLGPVEPRTPAKVPPHEVLTGNAKPVCQPLRRKSPAEQQLIGTKIKEMLERGWIRKSTSAHAVNVVVVRKWDGDSRMCIDYRPLNAVTMKDEYPLPRIDDTLDAIAGAQYLSKMDCTSGYWQVAMAEVDVPKTAFRTASGLYEFVVMPFGLINAPATFQRAMDTLLVDLKCVCLVVYLDDLLVYSRSWAAHLVDL